MRRFILPVSFLLVLCLAGAFAGAYAADRVPVSSPFEDPEGPALAPPAPPLSRAPAGAAATINVPGDYSTIQAAIDAAASGDVIVVAANTYAEAILIVGKNLTIQGAGIGNSIITGVAGNTTYIVKFMNSAVVDFSGFTIDGTGKNIQYGIYAYSGVDGDIHDNEVKNVAYPSAGGIAVRRQESYIDVTDNLVYGFGRIGIYTRDDVIGNTDTGVISGNTVTGLGGSDPDRLSYGISVYSGNPTVDDNEISGCYSGANVAQWLSCAIDVWTGSTSALTNNDIHDSEYGIVSNSASPTISGNTFTNIDEEEVRLDFFVKGNPTPHWAEYYNTIQAAINAIPTTTYRVIVWIGIYSGGGVYNEAVNVNKACAVYGDSRATVTINPVGFAVNNAGVYVAANNVELYSFTLTGSLTNSLPRYGVKFGNYDGCVLWDAEIRNVYRGGVDILGATNLTITDVYSHDNGGNGIQMCDASNVALTDVTTAGNAWGGVGIFTWGQYTPIGVSGVVFSGTNNFGETASDVGSIYLERGDYSNPSSPYPITYSTNILDGADVTLQLADVTHALDGNSDNANDYTRFYATLSDAQSAAAGVVSHITDGRYITELAGTDLYVPAYLGSIQAAVDAANPGDVVHVDAGSFEEQVEVAKALTIDGAGKAATIIQSPTTLTKFFGTNYPVVYIHDANGVVISDLTVDGLGRGNANYRFVGIGYRNAGGTVSSCEVLNIKDTPFSGAQHGVAVYAYNDDLVSRSITVEGCDISGFQKNAMALNAGDTTPLVVDVDGNTITGAGPTSVTAQNGVQVWADAGSGTVQNNTITGVGYTGSGWVATSILNFYTDLDITDNAVSNAHVGVYNIDGAGTISGNDVDVELMGGYCWGIIASDPPDAVPSPFGEETAGGSGSAALKAPLGSLAVLDVDITGNTVTNVGTTVAGTYGIECDAGYGPNDLDVTITYNTVCNFEAAIEVWECQSSCDTGVFTSVVANYNYLGCGNTYGIRSNADGIVTDGTNNWWGDASGPYHATLNPGGSGVQVSDYVDFDPWMTAPNLVSVVPAYDITNCTTPVTYTFHITRAGSSDEARGYDVKFDVDNTVVTVADAALPMPMDIVEGDYLSDAGGTTFFVIDNGGGTYTVSCAILGGDVGATGDGDLFTVMFTPVAEGVSPISMVSLKLRDLDNQPLGVTGADGEVRIDCTPPLMQAIVEAQNECYNHAPTFSVFTFRDDVGLDLADYQIDSDGWNAIFTGLGFPDTVWTDLDWELPGFATLAEGTHTVYFRVKDDAGNWNGEGAPQPALYSWSFIKDTVPPAAPTDLLALPGHNKVHLTWTNPTGDASFEGVMIRRVGWGDYPQYGTPGPGAPGYPADETQGALVTETALEAYDDLVTPRDIYYYAAFSVDCAGNYSSGTPGSQDRSTSYWLADMIPTMTGDGLIDILDLGSFSGTFGVAQGGMGWNAEGDFGPTDDWSRFGIPLPDDVVDFEDLMILAMNYHKVSPLGSSGAGVLASAPASLRDQVAFRLVLLSREGEEATYALEIENGAEVLKGFSLRVVYGAGNDLSEIKASSRLTGKGGEHFFGTIARERGEIEVCVAALGVNTPFGYTGEVARLVVKETAPGTAYVSKVDLRDLENRRDEVTLPGGGGEVPFVPVVSALGQNHPNPFNPVTTITYDVAQDGAVRIEIYDVTGRLVRTLVDAHKGAGRHTTVWDGRDNGGNGVHSGVYFYRMTAPGYTSPAKKMLLLK